MSEPSAAPANIRSMMLRVMGTMVRFTMIIPVIAIAALTFFLTKIDDH